MHMVGVSMFKPVGVHPGEIDWLNLTLDEFEALRLADLDGLYQDQAAERMHVSRATFGRIVESARHKVARALLEGLGLVIEGGNVHFCPGRRCRHRHTYRRGFAESSSASRQVAPETGDRDSVSNQKEKTAVTDSNTKEEQKWNKRPDCH